MYRKEKLSRFIKGKSRELGFSICGLLACKELTGYRPRLEDWLDKGHNADMAWMERNLDKRLDPGLLVEGAKSIIVLALNYYQEYKPGPGQPVFSRYALGADYHKILKDKIYLLLDALKAEAGELSGRVFVDSAPVLEKAWAEEGGLGWIGKNGMLINPAEGSWLFLGELIIDLELVYDRPAKKDYCGNCTRCIEACPTGAILNNRTIDSAKCISYLTIEKKGEFTKEEQAKQAKRVFGCDICQEVCPWNSRAKETGEKAFDILPEIAKYSIDDWKKITEEEFNLIFRNSGVLRTGYKGFMRNLGK